MNKNDILLLKVILSKYVNNNDVTEEENILFEKVKLIVAQIEHQDMISKINDDLMKLEKEQKENKENTYEENKEEII